MLASSISSTSTQVGRNVLVLGDKGSGKSSLVAALVGKVGGGLANARVAVSELGLSYSCLEVAADDMDDNETEAVSRIGIYQLAGDATLAAHHPSFLPFDIVANGLQHFVILLVLDWSRPWLFLESLARWIAFVDKLVEHVSSANNDSTATTVNNLKDLRAKIEAYYKAFSVQDDTQQENVDVNGNSTITTTKSQLEASLAEQLVVDLEDGVLTNNLGVPIIIVCTKSDYTLSLEKEHDFHEETFDYIQQSLRAFCLKLGAALFYTSSHKSATIDTLRKYIKHRLFTKTESTASNNINNTSSITTNTLPPSISSSSSSFSTYPFTERAQVIDRDVMVPAGRDSWNKIKLLRENFNVDSYVSATSTGISADDVKSLVDKVAVAYCKIVMEKRDPGQIQNTEPKISAEDEQAFLKKQLDILNQDTIAPTISTVDHITSPRQLLSASTEALLQKVGGSGMASSAAVASVSSSLAGNNDIMEDVGAKLARLSKMKEQRSDVFDKLKAGTEASSTEYSSPTDKKAALMMNAASSSSSGSSQNEVLANFFQSLLSKKSSPTTASPK